MSLITEDRIKETSTTTGTGTLTLAGAATGFRAFSSVMTSPSDTCYYTIQAVDANGTPTGDWETGIGTYSASNTLTRTTVQRSSNSNSAVSFGAGTKQVFIDATAAYLALREVTTNKDASGGYAGLTLFKIDFKNAANTFTSFLTNANTAARTYTFQDRNGTIADDTDLALKASLAGTTAFTAAQTINLNSAALPAAITGTMLQIGQADTVANYFMMDAFAAINRITFRRANGTNSSKSALGTNTSIGQILADGYGATGYFQARAAIYFKTTQAWTDTAQGTQIVFNTTPNGSTTLAAALTLDQDLSATFTGVNTVNLNTASLPTALTGTALRIGGADSTGPRIAIDSFAGTPAFSARRAQGTAASPSAVTSGLDLLALSAFGYGATGYVAGTKATISLAASQDWTDTANGTKVTINTCANGTTTLAPALVLDNDKSALFSGVVTSNLNTTSLPTAVTGAVLRLGQVDSTATVIEIDSFNASPQIVMRRANTSNASKSFVATSNALFVLGARGYGATDYASGNRAQMLMQASQDWTDSAQGTFITFSTTPTGSTTAATALTIGQDQSLAVVGALSAGGDVTLSQTTNKIKTAATSSRLILTGGTTGGTTDGSYISLEGYDYTGAAATGGIQLVSTTGGVNNIKMLVGGTLRGDFSSTGLAVTGTLSATSTASATQYTSTSSSASLPSFNVTGAGIYNSGTNQMGVACNSVQVANFSSTGLAVTGQTTTNAFATNQVANSASTYTVLTTDHTIKQTTANSTYTLPTASSFTGRELLIFNIGAFSVISASSNVYPQGSSSAGTAILAATSGKWAKLKSDGTNWQIIASN